MRDHPQQVERTRVFRIGSADKPIEPFSVGETTGAMLSHRGRERLFRTAPGTHADISMASAPGLTSVARPIAPETQIDLAGAAVDPDRLIAAQRARRPIRCVACNVGGGMENEPAAAIGRRQNGSLLISD